MWMDEIDFATAEKYVADLSNREDERALYGYGPACPPSRKVDQSKYGPHSPFIEVNKTKEGPKRHGHSSKVVVDEVTKYLCGEMSPSDISKFEYGHLDKYSLAGNKNKHHHSSSKHSSSDNNNGTKMVRRGSMKNESKKKRTNRRRRHSIGCKHTDVVSTEAMPSMSNHKSKSKSKSPISRPSDNDTTPKNDYQNASPADAAKYGYGDDVSPSDAAKYGYGNATKSDAAKYGYGNASPEDATKYGYGDASPSDAAKYGYGDASPSDAAKYGYGDASPSDAAKYGYGDASPSDAAKYGYGDASPSDTAKYGYGDASPSDAAKYGYGDTTTTNPSSNPSRGKTPRRSSMKQEGSSTNRRRRHSIQHATTELEVTIRGKDKPVRRRRSIGFDENSNIVHEQPQIEDRKAIWFLPEELQLIKVDRKIDIEKAKHGQVERDGDDYCSRGLEKYVEPKNNRRRKKAARAEVLQEQEHQEEKGKFNEQRLKDSYQEYSKQSHERAAARAAQDAQDIEKYTRGIRRRMRRRMSC